MPTLIEAKQPAQLLNDIEGLPLFEFERAREPISSLPLFTDAWVAATNHLTRLLSAGPIMTCSC